MKTLLSAMAGLIVIASATAFAQNGPPAATRSDARLRVYLDCDSCFAEYLRSEITWVDFVRQREDADVLLLSSSNDTGGGGREVVLRFIGASRLAGFDRSRPCHPRARPPSRMR